MKRVDVLKEEMKNLFKKSKNMDSGGNELLELIRNSGNVKFRNLNRNYRVKLYQ